MADRGGLENRCARERTVGSNPTPSAKYMSRTFPGMLYNGLYRRFYLFQKVLRGRARYHKFLLGLMGKLMGKDHDGTHGGKGEGAHQTGHAP